MIGEGSVGRVKEGSQAREHREIVERKSPPDAFHDEPINRCPLNRKTVGGNKPNVFHQLLLRRSEIRSDPRRLKPIDGEPSSEKKSA